MSNLPESNQNGNHADEPTPLSFFSRREIKYALEAEFAGQLRELVSDHLPGYEFKTGHPYTYITSIYFDTDNLDFFNKARVSYDDNLKIRVKEYYYRAPEGLITYPYCFVEIKQRVQGLVMKRRIRLPKPLLNRFMRGEDVWKQIVQEDSGVQFEDIEEIYSELRRYLKTYRVRPSSIIHYRRNVYQRDENELRITFDDQLQVFEPLEGLYRSVDSLHVGNLGPPIRTLRRFILEIKCLREYPDWLSEGLSDVMPRRISKFTTSIQILSQNGSQDEVDGDPDDDPGDGRVKGLLREDEDKLSLLEPRSRVIGNLEDTQDEDAVRP